MTTVPLIGYSDKLSVRPGEEISFKVSSEHKNQFLAELFRSISADPNPEGPGIVEMPCKDVFAPRLFPSRSQKFFPGSYGVSSEKIFNSAKESIVLNCIFFPTTFNSQKQTILSYAGICLSISKDKTIELAIGQKKITLLTNLSTRVWYKATGTLVLGKSLKLLVRKVGGNSQVLQAEGRCSSSIPQGSSLICSIGAKVVNSTVSEFFNGKIENPEILVDGKLLASWDFSKSIKKMVVPGMNCPKIELKNFPTRAVTSSQWNGSEMNWNYRPEHYSAIHFHEDDIYDFEWKTDFSFTIPDKMESGVYVMRLKCAKHEDAIPFFVCPKINKPTSRVCVLVSTFTYSVYGNHARPDYKNSWQKKNKDWNGYPYNPAEYKNYGLSTYNYHSDGSGICHASFKRPLFNLRPGYITFGDTQCSGLRHFQADSHLIAWLHDQNIKYDVVTDNEIHNEGLAAIKNYSVVLTGTHPEYHTTETLNALEDYKNKGGSLNYLGGNGFYWKIARHSDHPDILEIRRAEDGIRAWASEPGEYYNAFDGTYGGLWRRNGRPPQRLVGVGFTAQGTFVGMPYKRVCRDPDLNWIFDGIDEELLGDFGFSGNGAAGFELDRTDRQLDNGENIRILAQSYDNDGQFVLVPEEQLTHITNLSGDSEFETKRADMIYFETDTGGSVFSAGSITFCGCLPWNNFQNNISKLLANIVNARLNLPTK